LGEQLDKKEHGGENSPSYAPSATCVVQNFVVCLPEVLTVTQFFSVCVLRTMCKSFSQLQTSYS